MSNPAQLTGANPATIVSSSNLQSLSLESDRSYTFAHNAIKEAGSADTAIVVFVNHISSGINTNSGPGKWLLTSSRSIAIGPGIKTIYFQCNSGVPTFDAVPGELNYGRY